MDEDGSIAITLTANDSQNDDLTFEVVSQFVNGSLSGTAPQLVYTPGADFNSADSFSFIASGQTLDSATASRSSEPHVYYALRRASNMKTSILQPSVLFSSDGCFLQVCNTNY